MVRVWAAVATPEGLPSGSAAADLLEPPWAAGDTALAERREGGSGNLVSGRVTAWDMEAVAEYTVEVHGRVRFHLEPAAADSLATVLRFTNEFTGSDEQRLDSLAGWHQHFEYLSDALDGRPADWAAWTPDRFQHLRAEYAGRR